MPGSGIYRHVRLIATGYTQFRLDGGVSVTTPEVTPKKATVEADYIIDANFFIGGGATGVAQGTPGL